MRLIDVDKIVFYTPRWSDGEGLFTKWLKETLKNAPTVDAVPVIRCKDCKWYEFDEPHRCGFGGHGVRGKSDYCSDAERKDNETD